MVDYEKTKIISGDEVHKLAVEHWDYIEKLLRIHNEDEIVIRKIKFHYIQAMKHGYKHGVSEVKK